mmetsp:Transcript_22874/g.47446  ORF Transcript_22874/g.47446 Transcript_22874/m.47446 type:complete len:266 (-) Transcript_22874:46-843(-)
MVLHLLLIHLTNVAIVKVVPLSRNPALTEARVVSPPSASMVQRYTIAVVNRALFRGRPQERRHVKVRHGVGYRCVYLASHAGETLKVHYEHRGNLPYLDFLLRPYVLLAIAAVPHVVPVHCFRCAEVFNSILDASSGAFNGEGEEHEGFELPNFPPASLPTLLRPITAPQRRPQLTLEQIHDDRPIPPQIPLPSLGRNLLVLHYILLFSEFLLPNYPLNILDVWFLANHPVEIFVDTVEEETEAFGYIVLPVVGEFRMKRAECSM